MSAVDEPTAGWTARAVIDIETRPDGFARTLAGRRSGIPRGSVLNEITAVAVLGFRERTDGAVGDFRISSFDRTVHSERDILLNLSASLSPLIPAGRLVTFNGGQFDLPMLSARARRWWIVDGPLADATAGDVDHVDVILDFSSGRLGRWPTLTDACAMLGFCLHGPRTARQGEVSPEIERCGVDVLGTTLLYLYTRASQMRSLMPIDGLPELGRWVRLVAVQRPHFERFTYTALLADEIGPCGAPGAYRRVPSLLRPRRVDRPMTTPVRAKPERADPGHHRVRMRDREDERYTATYVRRRRRWGRPTGGYRRSSLKRYRKVSSCSGSAPPG